jgi:PKD repeat protein
MWTFDGGNPQNSDLKDPVIIYETAGTYTVSLKTTNSFGENTETIENIIIVEETPEADFDTSIDGNLVSFNNISLNAENYEWNFGNGKTNTEENPINEYDQNGVYNVTLIAINGFCTDTIRKEIIIDVSSIDNALSNAVSVYPNPAKNIVYIKIETGYQIEKIKLFDINGKLILDESINDHVELIPINISELNNGTYMLNINSQNKSAFKKLTILR